jgi:ABC-2 type transport system ATP-binding protein
MNEASDAIACQAVNVSFQGQPLLSNINLQIKTGEIIGLIGSNGAGKSTLLKTIVGLIPSMMGNCTIFGTDCRHPSSRQHLTFLPEKFYVASLLKGQDFLRIMNFDDVGDLCQRFDFAPTWLNHPVKRYSKGMLQKLGLLYLFSSTKPLLIADELMSGLDMKTRTAVYSYMQLLRERGSTIFFSTHIAYDLIDFCDQVLTLENGYLSL